MALCIKKGVAFVALFSALTASADWFDDLARTPKEQIHQPPKWIDHLATLPKVKPNDDIPFVLPIASSYMGDLSKIKRQREYKACRKANGDWAFCDL